MDDVLSVFLITESYLFRRNICEVPTNALNKIFLNLNREVLRYNNTANDYVNKMIYTLLSKKESGRFPNDKEFTESLATKQVYQMRGKYKAYLFERFENYGTVETKDVYTHLDNNIYSIEHIMPQHLMPAWTEALGPNYAEIHTTWLHRLANLTLTGYNPSLSNNSFAEKRDAEESGYRASGLKMNQKIARKDSWGLPELEERSAEMAEQAKTIWAHPKTDFVPAKKEFDSCSLDDEKAAEADRYEIRKRYWAYAIPIIQEQHLYRGTFSNVNPTGSNTLSGFFGISGFCVSCIANYDSARVDFYLGNGDAARNKEAFVLLFAHREEIEQQLGAGKSM